MNRSSEKPALHALLAAHFAPATLEELAVTRRDFPNWMRPDLQRALEALFGAIPGHRFVGARLRDRELDFRFADLVESGGKAVAIGPAVYQDADIGERRPVACLCRGLWLAECDGVRFALLLDASDGYHGVRVRIELAVPRGEAPARLAAQLANRLKIEAERGACWRGKALVLDGAHDDFELSAAACARPKLPRCTAGISFFPRRPSP